MDVVVINPINSECYCNDIFANETVKLLNQEYCECEWSNDNFSIIIYLNAFSTLTINSKIILNKDSLVYKFENNNEFERLEDDFTIETILAPSNPIKPVLVLSQVPTKISICDGLTLDARNSRNLGITCILCLFLCLSLH